MEKKQHDTTNNHKKTQNNQGIIQHILRTIMIQVGILKLRRLRQRRLRRRLRRRRRIRIRRTNKDEEE